jgi:chromosome segregation protein
VFLDRLEVHGFKSFAKRIQLRFSPGITAVVGPNGCGKSNIADAVRWALGEQNVRSLRGRTLQDVIFKGTREAKPAGMAEVTLHMDNQDQRLGTEFSQVAIRRRAFRSGESEFSINKAPCRLRDIRGLFMDTGLGSSEYAVIEREMIDEVLADRDEARRFLLDETAGITRYKQRRKETLRKIAAVEEDLTRVEDVLEIEERQIRSLAYQMGKARRYRRLSDRIQALDVGLARLQWQELAKAAAGESGRLSDDERERETLNTALHDLDARQETLRVDLLELNQTLAAAQKKLTETEMHLASNREESLVLQERRRALAERTEDLEARIQQSETAREEAETQLRTIEPQLESANAELASRRRVSADAEKEWIRADEALRATREHLGEHQQMHIDQVRRRSVADQQLRGSEGRLEDLGVQGEKISGQIETLGARSQGLREEIDKLEARRSALAQEQEQTGERMRVLETERLGGQDRADEIGEQIGRVGDEAARTESRLLLLEEQARTHEGFGTGVAELLENRAERPGVLGVAAELLAVAPEWSERLAPALREVTAWVVTDSEKSAWEAIAWLSSRGLGQVTFLPLEGLAGGAPRPKGGLPDDAITPRRPEAAPLVTFLCASFVPVDSHAEIAPPDEREAGRRWITPNGEVISSMGWLASRGGSAPDERLWSRPEEIEALREKLSGLQAEHAQLAAEVEKLRAKESETLARRAALEQEREERGGQIENLSRSLVQRQAEERLLTEELARLGQEGDQLAQRREEAARRLEGSRQDLDRAQEEEGTADADFREAQKGVEAAAAEKDRLGEQHSEKKMEVLWAEAQLKELRGQADGRRADLEEAERHHATASRELGETLAETESATERIVELGHEEGQLVEQREGRGEEVERWIQGRGRMEESLTEIEKELRERRRALSKIEEALRHDEVQLARFEAERQRLQERMKEQYDLDLASLPPLRRRAEPEGGEDADEGTPLAAEGPPDASVSRSPADDAERAAGAAYHGTAEKTEPAAGEADPSPAEADPSPAEEAEPDPLEGMRPEEVAEKLETLRRERDRLGPVNQLAIEEHEQKREHVRFVKSQRDDLLQSRDALLAAIDRINTEARRLFEETFTQVQENFVRTFGTLFPGGEAKLRLAGDDPLEAGIEMMARPRGKRLESIHLLSSGERALTATALLFALYLVKPSPFCVLDEVDAPLDDANIDRFLNLLRSFSDKTQFVVITHNKRTMEVADALYGVTMQEPGISRIVSVRLEGGQLLTEDGEEATISVAQATQS